MTTNIAAPMHHAAPMTTNIAAPLHVGDVAVGLMTGAVKQVQGSEVSVGEVVVGKVVGVWVAGLWPEVQEDEAQEDEAQENRSRIVLLLRYGEEETALWEDEGDDEVRRDSRAMSRALFMFRACELRHY
jgi:hypothetical protein